MRHRLALLVLLLAVTARGQQLPRYRDTMEVRLVEIDVIVTDREGKRVYGLSKDDFIVFEGKKQQAISNFTEYRDDAGPLPAAAGAVQPSSRPSPRQPETLLILLDYLSDRFYRAKVLEQLEKLLPRLMQPGDRVSVVYWQPHYDRAETIIDASTSLAAVSAAIQRFGGVNVPEAIDLAEGGTSLSAREAFLARFRRKTAAVQRLVTALGSSPGKKTMLYVSDGFTLPVEIAQRQAARSMLDELTKAANAGGVTLYAVYPVMPEFESKRAASASQYEPPQGNIDLEALNRMTEPTGGLVDFGARSVETLGEQIAEDGASYYSIAYRARTDGRDRERSIVVKSRNPDYHVRSRRSSVEKSPETRARDALLTCLFSNCGVDDLRFTVQEGQPRRTGRDRWLLPLSLKIPTDQLRFQGPNASRKADLKVLITAANGITEMAPLSENEIHVPEANEKEVNYSVEILCDRRGSTLSIGVMDRNSGFVGVRTIDTRGRFGGETR